jgi:hypothetical protein
MQPRRIQMRGVITGALLALATMVAVPAVEAKPAGSHSKGGHSGYGKDYRQRYGTRFSHGYYYSGRHHNHWTYRCWYSRYGCECYYCPSACCWYYWSEPRNCYLPVSYIEQSRPVPVSAQAFAQANAVNNVTINTGGVPVASASVVPAPPSGAGPVQSFKNSQTTP